ncbi:M23 family metallopeptidase [Heliophilum fasciatum]|uniref:Murein DD-endopeptidase MepM/ murein hydrolase activator NlpD n=1 Tax=Heliophilum fasciatum TaxID=35700 RepID=A0A4R2RFD7_9FIRM|nr:M23 family metallopeptidase [Heliophilum fasciatum]MCW2279356.1 murein DD-endopeptidase MepM/ murein hydrolase activator NlpD [Heliophilum fasciatum]TCP60787.1 murein DD-endopeptidase MepM/ murein hydrolase activator NlpD [Heliophilum fasciatum]
MFGEKKGFDFSSAWSALQDKIRIGDWQEQLAHQPGVEWQRQPWVKWVAVGATMLVLAGGVGTLAVRGSVGGENAAVAQQLPDHVVRKACQIVLDGNPAFIVANRQEAETLINDAVHFFSYGQCGPGMEVTDVKVKQTVTYQDVDVTGDRVLSTEQAKKLLTEGKEDKLRYVVQKGDTLWSVATKNGMSWSELRKANTQLVNDNKLKIGQEIFLNRPSYYLTVVSTYKISTEEDVPYSTKVEKDKNMRAGAVKVKQEGVKGRKLATYVVTKENNYQKEQDLVAEQTLKKPVDRIEVRADRVYIASRGSSKSSRSSNGEGTYSGGGSGQLSWPTTTRRISSPYGYRGREFHPAIDIDLNTGDPVFAAAEGVVVSAGWSGGYGKCVVIDHGGMKTKYAHLSQINVGTGETVSRGQTIGLGGATGRATGSHLHFEVQDGGTRNPMGYVN